jgi:hypothetical protein
LLAVERPTTAPRFTLAGLLLTGVALGVTGLALVRSTPLLLAGAWNAPPVLATVHLATLGALSMGILAALGHVGPGILGIGLAHAWRHWGVLAALTLGTLVVPLAIGTWRPTWLLVGWSAVVVAFALVASDIVRPLVTSSRTNASARAVLLSGVFAGAALALGGLRTAIAAWDIPLSPAAIAEAHAVLGLVGFGTLLAMGVARQVLPAFLRVPTSGVAAAAAMLPMTAIGSAIAAASALAQWRPGRVLGALLLVMAAIAWMHFVWHAWWHRARPSDMPAHLMVASASMLPASGVVGALIVGAPLVGLRLGPQWVVAWGVLLLGGWLIGVIVAVAARLVPRLSAMRRRSAAGATRQVPRWQVALLAIGGWGWIGGCALLAIALVLRASRVAMLASAVVCAAAWVLALVHLRIGLRAATSASP